VALSLFRPDATADAEQLHIFEDLIAKQNILMQKIKMYQVDAFTDQLFRGNPAAVCILDQWLSDQVMQSVAFENNLAETAFVVKKDDNFEIRWFTPATEVDLCGHATLASAFVVFHLLNYPHSTIRFFSRHSGWLTVEKKDDMLYLDFPTDTLETTDDHQKEMIKKCTGISPIEVFKGRANYIAVIEGEHALHHLQPDFQQIAALDAQGLIVTARGDQVDFVSRYFAPQLGIDEDPVTGSAHTSLIPLWYKKLGKNTMMARQISRRGGDLFCEFKNERCLIGGKARLYLTGEILTE
jgi:PhzF family phenazine biosynthesis protein